MLIRRVRSQLRMGIPILAALMLIVTGCGSSESESAAPSSGAPLSIDNLRVGYVASGILGGAEGYALKHGNFRSDLADAGVKSIETIPFPGGSQPVLQALVGGSIDIGFLGNSAFLTARGNGQDLVLLNETLVGLDLWVVGRPGGPTTLDGLAGKKVAIPFGDVQERVGKVIAQRANIDGIQWVNVPPTGQAEALANGSVDAAVVFARGTWARLVQKQGYPLISKVSVDYPDLVGASVTVTTPQFLEKHPGFADAYEKARLNAVKLIQQNVQAYNQFQADEFREGTVTAEEESVYYPADKFQTQPFTEHGLTLLRSELEWLVANGAVKKSFDLDSALAKYSK